MPRTESVFSGVRFREQQLSQRVRPFTMAAYARIPDIDSARGQAYIGRRHNTSISLSHESGSDLVNILELAALELLNV